MKKATRVALYSYAVGDAEAVHRHDCPDCWFCGQLYRHQSEGSDLITQVADVYLDCEQRGIVVRTGALGDYEYMRIDAALLFEGDSERWKVALQILREHPIADGIALLGKGRKPIERKELKVAV